MSDGRLYSVVFTAVSITAQQDLFYVKPAADKVCSLEAIYLSNVGIAADAGDAQEELLDVEIVYVPATVTASSGGNTYTPNILLGTAAGATARINDTTKATSSGTLKSVHSDGWNVRVPYVYLPPPEHRWTFTNADAFTFRLNSTPTDAVLVSGTLYFREIP